MSISRGVLGICLLASIIVVAGASVVFGQASVSTDRGDYAPGDTVSVTGAGWLPGETVTLTFEENPAVNLPELLYAVASASGDIFNNEFIAYCLGDSTGSDSTTAFTLTAEGQVSGFVAQTTFTDFWCSNCVGDVEIGSQSPSELYQSGRATYTIRVERGCWILCGFSVDLYLNWSGSPPSGTHYEFTPSRLYFSSGSDYVKTATLTIDFSCDPTASRSFTVVARRSSSDSEIDFGSVNVTYPGIHIEVYPPYIMRSTGSYGCYAEIPEYHLPDGYATGSCGRIAVYREGIPANNHYPVGITHIDYWAEDPYTHARVHRTFDVHVVDNTPPIVYGPSNKYVSTGPDATTCNMVIEDIGTATYYDNCEVYQHWVEGIPAGNLYPAGTTVIRYYARDRNGNLGSDYQNITVHDGTPPVITHMDDMNVVTDAGACTAVVGYTPVATDNCGGLTVVCNPASGSEFDLGTTPVTVIARDGWNNTAMDTFTVTVSNPDPGVTISGPASGAIFAAGAPVEFFGAFTDNKGDLHSAEWTLGDSVVAGTVDEGMWRVTGTHTFDDPGVYLVRLTVTDQCGGTGTASTVDGMDAMVVVYDPNEGFVTGGGWIDSPVGAYRPDTTLTGRANFGFVSKYVKGADTPSGQTEFRFKVAELNFHSTTYDWLVIAGAKAMYKGSGTINGEGDYGFLISAIDGDIRDDGIADRFRIKIVDKTIGELVYDNQVGSDEMDDPLTTLGGGAVVIHKSAVAMTAQSDQEATDADSREELPPAAYRLFQNHPNPFNPATSIVFELPIDGPVDLAIYDVTGRLVVQLVNEWTVAGRHSIVWEGRNGSGQPVASGIYFYRIEAGDFAATRRMVLLR